MELPNLRIIPLSQTHIHELTLDKPARRIADLIAHSGLQRNPIIAAEVDGEYIVIDGMHRFAALKRLNCNGIVACIVDYFDDSIELKGWYLSLDNLSSDELCAIIERTAPHLERQELPVAEAQKKMVERTASFGVLARGESCVHVYTPKDGFDLERFINMDQAVLKAIQEHGTTYRLVGDEPCEKILAADPQCVLLLLRPVYRKQEVVERALADKLFPPKSTRHVIPGRPLRLDIPLSILRSDLTTEQMDRILCEETRNRWKLQKIRHYPEPVFIYDE
ncbi:MAG: ParB N-terminal domain-containing protein [Methanopyri archaeon]|nr:ParB N-terminal domain-containing protein [Methanopyri archaeon]